MNIIGQMWLLDSAFAELAMAVVMSSAIFLYAQIPGYSARKSIVLCAIKSLLCESTGQIIGKVNKLSGNLCYPTPILVDVLP